jgi:GxxExxY protein
MADGIVKTPYDDLTYKIIGCAMAVHREIGPGLREDSYQRALGNRLGNAEFAVEQQKLFEVLDQEQRLVGYYIPDYVVNGTVIVEIKALGGLDNSHFAQVLGYLTVTSCPVGLLINFGERSLAYHRIFPSATRVEYLVNHQWLFVPDWLKDEQARKK